MHYKYASKAIILLLVTTFFAMYQETPAQKRRSPKAKTTPVAVTPVAPEVTYTVSMSKPWTHLLEVEMQVKWTQMPDKTEIKMPVWTPGSYLVREYARHVQDLSVTVGSGAAIDWRKINKNTWEIDSEGAKEFKVNYRVYSNELTVRTNELNDEHGFWNNAALLMFVKGNLGIASTVKVNPYDGWRVATGLPPVAGQQNTFRAENYDILYDSPFEVSDYHEFKFTVEGKPHRLVFSGDGNYDGEKTAADVTKIVQQAYNIFGELPYDSYTFIVNLRGGGGLEHLNSTALQYPRFAFKPKARYMGFLGLVAHEYFHAFNVKRIRPLALGPFDYENENYTKSLWLAEGGTEYYSRLLLLRAGFIAPKEFLDGIANAFQQLQARPGRFETSLEDASFDAWIKYYRQDENSVNNQISYYDKGEIVSAMLDITIRTASGGTKTLDDVMRHLYIENYKNGRGYTPEEVQQAAELMAGKSLEDFFDRYVRGTDEIDYDSILRGIGLTLTTKDTNPDKAYVGANLTENDGKLTVRLLPSDSPAYEQGLNTGDEIVAIDGYRASQNFLQSYIADMKPGEVIKLTVFRNDKLRDIDFTLGADTRKTYSIGPVSDPSPEQAALYKSYLNAELK